MSLLGGHAIVLGVLLLHQRFGILSRLPADSGAAVRLCAEWYYGFLNPLLYLVFLGPAMPWPAVNAWMLTIAWALFLAVWTARLLVPVSWAEKASTRVALQRLCMLGLICLSAFTVKDVVTYPDSPSLSSP